MLGMGSLTPPASPDLEQLLAGIDGSQQPQEQPSPTDPGDLPQVYADAGWRRHISEREGRPYFYNIHTRQAVWQLPSISVEQAPAPAQAATTSTTAGTLFDHFNSMNCSPFYFILDFKTSIKVECLYLIFVYLFFLLQILLLLLLQLPPPLLHQLQLMMRQQHPDSPWEVRDTLLLNVTEESHT